MSKGKQKFLRRLPVLILMFCILLGYVFSYETRVIPIPGGIEYASALNMSRFLPFVLGGTVLCGGLILIKKMRNGKV